MKKHVIAATAALSLVATSAFAASNLTTSSGAPVGTTHNSTVGLESQATGNTAYVVDAPAKPAPAKKAAPKKAVKKKPVAKKAAPKKVEAPKVEATKPIVEADPVITPAPTAPATQY